MTEPLTLHVHAVGAVMGGAARHLAPFLAALRAERPAWRVHVWVTAGSNLEGLPDDVDVSSVDCGGNAGRLRWENEALPDALRRDGAHALLCLTNSGPLRSPVPMLLYQRNALWFDAAWLTRMSAKQRLEARLRRQLTFLQARSAAVVLTPSAAMAGFLTRWGGWPQRTPIRVVPHAVDLSRFKFRERRWPPPGDAPLRVLSVGHAAAHKDQLLIPDIADSLAADGVRSDFDVTVDRADDPGYVDRLTARIASGGLTDRVRLIGRVATVEALYDQADLLLVTSICESFGFPILEAMAAGLPIVASRIPASTELLGDRARWFEIGHADQAAGAIRALLLQDERSLRAHARSNRHVAETFTWAGNARTVAEAVESVSRDSMS